MKKRSEVARNGALHQRVAYFPDQLRKLLAEAEYCEHLADAEVSSRFEEYVCTDETISN